MLVDAELVDAVLRVFQSVERSKVDDRETFTGNKDVSGMSGHSQKVNAYRW